MKSSIKIAGIRNAEDVHKIKNAISSNQGVVACEVSLASRIVAMSFCEPRSWTRVLSS